MAAFTFNEETGLGVIVYTPLVEKSRPPVLHVERMFPYVKVDNFCSAACGAGDLIARNVKYSGSYKLAQEWLRQNLPRYHIPRTLRCSLVHEENGVK